MRPFAVIPFAAVLLAVPAAVLAGGADEGFHGVVHSIEGRYHVHATHIPFMGLMSFVARKATHGGVANMKVAEFENFDGPVDGDELNAVVAEKLGEGWERIIRETSRNGCEQTLIFIHPEGERMGLFVVDADGHELDVVQVSVDPAHLDDDIGHYSHHRHAAADDADPASNSGEDTNANEEE
jgi:hypothetical protein